MNTHLDHPTVSPTGEPFGQPSADAQGSGEAAPRLYRALLIALLLSACSAGVERPVDATVIDVYEDKSPMGCMGTDWNTVFQIEGGMRGRVCGKWGKPGDKVRGCIVTDASDPSLNGFRITCRAAIAAAEGRTAS